MTHVTQILLLFLSVSVVNAFVVDSQSSNGDILALLLRLENKVYTLESQLTDLQQKCGSCAGTGSSGNPTTSSGTGTGIGGQFVGCVYKNVAYFEGQTWKDGCDYKCTCVNEKTGYYKCTALCLTWSLPSQCSFTPPAPGMCCKTPNCPDGVQVNYPTGYTPA